MLKCPSLILYVVHEMNRCGEPTITSVGKRCCSSMPASRAIFVREFEQELSRLLHADGVKEFGDLIFLQHHVPPREPTDLCVDEQVKPLGPHNGHTSLVLDLMTFNS